MIQQNLELLHIHLLCAAFSALGIMLTCNLRDNVFDCLPALTFHDICDKLIHSGNAVDSYPCTI